MLLYFCCMPKNFPSSLFQSHISILTLIYSLFPRVYAPPLQLYVCYGLFPYFLVCATYFLWNFFRKINENKSLKAKKGDKRKYYVCGCCIEIIVVGFFFFCDTNQVDNEVVMIFYIKGWEWRTTEWLKKNS